MAYPGVPGMSLAGVGGGMGGQPQQQKKSESAIDFLERVKVVYADQPAVYNQFLDIMKEFKTNTIDTVGVIQRVKPLFKGHSDLTRGFAAFLPEEYKIDVQGDEDEVEMAHSSGGGAGGAGDVGGAGGVGGLNAQQAAYLHSIVSSSSFDPQFSS